jgi:hypothetical protein
MTADSHTGPQWPHSILGRGFGLFAVLGIVFAIAHVVDGGWTFALWLTVAVASVLPLWIGKEADTANADCTIGAGSARPALADRGASQPRSGRGGRSPFPL